MDQAILDRVYLLYKNFSTMLVYHGYLVNVLDYQEFVNIDNADIAVAKKKLNEIYEHKSNGTLSYSFWHNDTLGNAAIKSIVSTVMSDVRDRGISIESAIIYIVYPDKITPHSALSIRLALKGFGLRIKTIKEDRLGYDPIKHVAVPKHTICTKEEKEQVLKDFSLTKGQIPEIKKSEPAAVRIGANLNDLIRIDHVSCSMPECNGQTLYAPTWRIVT